MCSFLPRTDGPALSGSFALASSAFFRDANRGDNKEPAHPIRFRSLSSLPFRSVSSQWGTTTNGSPEVPPPPAAVFSPRDLPTFGDPWTTSRIPSGKGDRHPQERANGGPSKRRGVSSPPAMKPSSRRKRKSSPSTFIHPENEDRNKPIRRASSKSDRRRSHRRAAQSNTKKDQSPKRNGQSHAKREQSSNKNGHSHRNSGSRSHRRAGRSRRRIGRPSRSGRRNMKKVLPIKLINVSFPTPPDRSPCMTPSPKANHRPKSNHSPKSTRCSKSTHRPRSTHRPKYTHRHKSTLRHASSRQHKSIHRSKSRQRRNRCKRSPGINSLEEKRRSGHPCPSPKGDRLTAKQVQEGLFAPLLGSLDKPDPEDVVKRVPPQNYPLGHQYMPFPSIAHRIYRSPFPGSRTGLTRTSKTMIPSVHTSNYVLLHSSKATLSDSNLAFGRFGESTPPRRRPKSNRPRLPSARRRSECSVPGSGPVRFVSHSASPHRRIERPFDGLFCALPRPISPVRPPVPARPIRSAIA